MFGKFTRMLFAVVAAWLINNYRLVASGNMRLKTVRWYLLGVQTARNIFVNGLFLMALLLGAFGGIVLIHAGIFYLLVLALSPAAAALIMIALGLIYTGLCVYLLLVQCSDEKWMTLTGADKLVAQVLKDRK